MQEEQIREALNAHWRASAAGDVNGRSMLVQSARMEGRTAARNAVLGPVSQAAYDVVASGSFTIQVEKAEQNVPIDDSKFVKPAPAPEGK